MSRPQTSNGLEAADLTVIRDLVRFGALTRAQIERRYFDAALADNRLRRLVRRELARARKPDVQDMPVFEATRAGARVVKHDVHLDELHTSPIHLLHNLAVVDLADFLLATDPLASWWTERELASGKLVSVDPGHQPDGLLQTAAKRYAIELEHSDKNAVRYDGICRWFASATRIDGVRWYVTSPSVRRQVAAAIERNGLADQWFEVTVEPLPPGIKVPSWAR